MNVIFFKSYFINKLMYWFFAITIGALAVIYLKLHLNDGDRSIACAAFIGIGCIGILYLNRFDPKLIKFDRENIEISYISQPPYGKRNVVCSKNDIKAIKKDNILILSNQNGIIAKLRRKAVDAKDWKTLEKYFD